MDENKQKYIDQFIANDLTYYLFQKLDPAVEKDENFAIILGEKFYTMDKLRKILQYLKNEFIGQFPKAVEMINPTKANINKVDEQLNSCLP